MFPSYFDYRSHINTILDQASWKHQFHEKLHQDEIAIWNIIAILTGVTHKQCLKNRQKYFKEETKIYKKSNKQKIRRSKKLSSATQQLVMAVLRDFKINPFTIDLVPFKGEGSPAAADDWTLFIDEHDLCSYPKEAQQYVLAHEAMHIINCDHSIHNALHRLIPKKNKKIRTALSAFDRFQEKRADVLAMLRCETYLRGCISFLQLLQQREGADFEAPSHPKTSDRLALAENILLASVTPQTRQSLQHYIT